MAEAKGIFEVKGWDEKTYEELPNGGKLSGAKVTQHFSGDIIGEGNVIWLMAYPSANTAHFVGIQRFVGTVGGKKGKLRGRDDRRLRRQGREVAMLDPHWVGDRQALWDQR